MTQLAFVISSIKVCHFTAAKCTHKNVNNKQFMEDSICNGGIAQKHVAYVDRTSHFNARKDESLQWESSSKQ